MRNIWAYIHFPHKNIKKAIDNDVLAENDLRVNWGVGKVIRLHLTALSYDSYFVTRLNHDYIEKPPNSTAVWGYLIFYGHYWLGGEMLHTVFAINPPIIP